MVRTKLKFSPFFLGLNIVKYSNERGNSMALLLTLGCGLFFIVGLIAYRLIPNKSDKDKLMNLSIACAFIVIVGLIIFDIIPELIEIHKWWLILFVILGLGLLLLIDLFIPHHHHDHKEKHDNKKEHQEHLEHISIITIVALILHNIIEGVSLYSIASVNIKSGIFLMLGIGLHNLPFGFSIATIDNKKKTNILLILLIISGLIGGIISSVFGNLNIFLNGIILAITLGMIIHIGFLELLKEVINNIKKKETIYGIIIGIVLLIIINLI